METIDWQWIFMARIDGVNRGLHLLASIAAITASVYCGFRAYRFEKPIGINRVFLFLWLPLISIVFFYGLHETIFNPLYYASDYFLNGRSAQVVAILSDSKYTISGFLAVEVTMAFLGFAYLWRFLKFNLLPWLPFVGVCVFWFAMGLPVTVPVIPTGQAFTNTLTPNILESLYTLTFAIGFCGAFK